MYHSLSRISLSVMVLLCATAVSLADDHAGKKDKDIVETAVAAGSFDTLATALEAADLVGTLKGKGPFTVFAPTDEAFSQLPKDTVVTLLKPENKQQLVDILTYHVVAEKLLAKQVTKASGATTVNGQRVDIKADEGQVRLDDAKVVKTDITCSNGVIHVIDSVLLPESKNLAEVAKKAGKFNTLLAAAEAAGLVEPLTGKGPLTVFAPTDEAFEKLPEGTVESLLKPENKSKLTNILKYHVVSGRVYSPEAVSAGKAKTLQGDSVNITLQGETAKANDAKLLKIDIDASNGVIHVIDSVLLPSEGKQASNNPRRIIANAINEGAPLYNAGHAGECAKVYMTTVNNLLSMEDHGMSSHMVTKLEAARSKAKQTHCSNSQAWALRHALDSAYMSLTQVSH